MEPAYQRPLVAKLVTRMQEPRRFIQVLAGPRQSGKTTAVRQMLDHVQLPHRFARASQDLPQSSAWLQREWNEARLLAQRNEGKPVLLVVDEVQMISQWSASVKALWDEDSDHGTNLLVLLTGSSSLLLQKGLRESLTGRFELLLSPQWDYAECHSAFGMNLDEYLFFGGYPGSLPLRGERERWLNYMRNSIIEPSILKDVVSLERITKPALMQALFSLGAAYSGREVSYRKLMGQLDDAGNAGLLSGIQKYSDQQLRTRSSSPKLLVHDTSLMVASYGQYRDMLLTDPERRGHLVESAVGAYLLRHGASEGFDVMWWRDTAGNEVDFILGSGHTRTAIEVKSGRIRKLGGLDAFCARHPGTHSIVVGSHEAPLDAFLTGEVPLFA